MHWEQTQVKGAECCGNEMPIACSNTKTFVYYVNEESRQVNWLIHVFRVRSSIETFCKCSLLEPMIDDWPRHRDDSKKLSCLGHWLNKPNKFTINKSVLRPVVQTESFKKRGNLVAKFWKMRLALSARMLWSLWGHVLYNRAKQKVTQRAHVKSRLSKRLPGRRIWLEVPWPRP